jgi:penicillin-binding protein 1C
MDKLSIIALSKRLLTGFAAIVIVGVALNFIFPLPDKIDYSTTVYAADGTLLNAYLSKDEKWRIASEKNEISKVLQQALITKEDKYFRYHFGVNPVAIAKSAFGNVFHLKRLSGASTITMQVARMVEHRPRTIWSKLIEVFRAIQLEWKYSKDEILQLYFNLVPYGGNIEGIKSASLIYFQKPPQQLSLAEAVTLCIIPNRPNAHIRYGVPFLIKERNRWLRKFKQEKNFSAKALNEAMLEPLQLQRHALPKFSPHLAYRLKKSAKTTIKTNIQFNQQLKIEQLTRNYVGTLKTLNIKNAAVLVIDNRTMNVVAYVGSADYNDKTDGGQVDGVRAIREPGSTLKPLLYGLSFDKGLITPKTVLKDIPININGFSPENFDKLFHGYVTAEFALSNSLNIPAVSLLNKFGKDDFANTLSGLHFKKIKQNSAKLGLSLILGGCGVSLEELTLMYAAFANNGLYRNARYTSDAGDSVTQKVISPSANFMVTEILSNLARPDLPANWEQTTHLPKIAWKTGTSYARKDAWSIGYNKHYTVGVWVGNFSGEGAPALSGANIATPLLFNIFNTIDYNSPNAWYAMPKECGVRLVCSESGLIPGERCENETEDFFIPMVSSNKICEHIQEVYLTADEKYTYCPKCRPDQGYKVKYMRTTDPDMVRFFDTEHIPYEKVPPHNPECFQMTKEGDIRIISLVNNTEYYIDKTNPQPLLLQSEANADVKKIFWYVNNSFFKQCLPKEKVYFVPAEGPQIISCVDDRGRKSEIRIVVKLVNL